MPQNLLRLFRLTNDLRRMRVSVDMGLRSPVQIGNDFAMTGNFRGIGSTASELALVTAVFKVICARKSAMSLLILHKKERTTIKPTMITAN